MAITGRKTYFKLNGTDISGYFNGIAGSNNTEELDGTTFQPDVAIPQKDILYGYNDKRYALSGVWTPAAELFFNGPSGIDGALNIPYVLGPQGHATTQTRIRGNCNVGKYSGPSNSTSGITTFTAECAVTSQIVDTFDGGSPD